MRRAAVLCLVLALAPACNDLLGIPAPSLIDGGTGDDGGESDGQPDADPFAPVDGAPPDADAPPARPQHLLLTEVNATGVPGEFVEIFNPLPVEVDLRDYYLTDDPSYYLVPDYDRRMTTQPLRNRDLIARFPEGSALPPGGVIVIAAKEDEFRGEFSVAPDYAVVPSATDHVAEPMEIIAHGGVPIEIVDSGEAIILFWWDGQSDLVTDVDIVLVGETKLEPGSDNALPLKTDLSVDGPDDNAMAETYLPDAVSMLAMAARHSGTYRRIAREEEHEASSGGNGVGGHDETSEDTRVTWEQVNNTPPSPGVIEFP